MSAVCLPCLQRQVSSHGRRPVTTNSHGKSGPRFQDLTIGGSSTIRNLQRGWLYKTQKCTEFFFKKSTIVAHFLPLMCKGGKAQGGGGSLGCAQILIKPDLKDFTQV